MNQQSDSTAERMRQLLEAYKNESIGEDEKQELFRAIWASLHINLNPSEKKYFEIIVNRYLLREPLMLRELSEIYNIQPEGISTWETSKGFELLALAVFRMKYEERLRKWIEIVEKGGSDRDRAKRLWIISGHTLTPTEIGKSLGISNKLIGKWKSRDRWADECSI